MSFLAKNIPKNDFIIFADLCISGQAIYLNAPGLAGSSVSMQVFPSKCNFHAKVSKILQSLCGFREILKVLMRVRSLGELEFNEKKNKKWQTLTSWKQMAS